MEMEITQDPRAVIRTPVLLQQYRGDIIRETVRKFEEKGITLSRLTRWQKKMPIIYPWDDDYDVERIGYNRIFQMYPMAIIMAEKVEHIQWAIKHAVKLSIEFSLKSGGHDHTGFCLSNGFIICLSKRNHISIENDVVEVGAGVLFGHLDMETVKHNGHTTVHGTCANTCITGLTLGGGFGLFTRKYGLACDNVLSIDIVLGDGNHVRCSKENKSDLFWALCGAGATSFGAVTGMKVRSYPVDELYLYELEYTPSQLRDLYKQWQKFAPYATVNLASKIVIAPTKPFAPDKVILKGQYLGPQSELEALIKSFLDNAIKSRIWCSSLLEAAEYNNEASATPPWFFFYQSLFAVEDMNDNLIDVLVEFATNSPIEVSMVINALGGKFAEVSVDETAFPWRDAKVWIHILGETSNQRDYDELKNYVNSVYTQLLNHGLRNPDTGIGRLYCNFKDLALNSEDYPKAYWNNHYRRLQHIKRKYDPNNVFYMKQGIHPRT